MLCSWSSLIWILIRDAEGTCFFLLSSLASKQEHMLYIYIYTCVCKSMSESRSLSFCLLPFVVNEYQGGRERERERESLFLPLSFSNSFFDPSLFMESHRNSQFPIREPKPIRSTPLTSPPDLSLSVFVEMQTSFVSHLNDQIMLLGLVDEKLWSTLISYLSMNDIFRFIYDGITLSMNDIFRSIYDRIIVSTNDIFW